MSIVSTLASSRKSNKLVIPLPGKMFRSSISKDVKALGFVINKGYLEMDTKAGMQEIIRDIDITPSIVLVGGVERVRLSNHSIVYRQRVFFKSLRHMLNLCRLHLLWFELDPGFHVTINSVMNCLDDLKYLERYARRFKLPIDVWLTNCCIVHLHFYLLSLNMTLGLDDRVDVILQDKVGYLDRAPFLVSTYSIDDTSSGLFLELNTKDTRLYSKDVVNELYLTYGYTTANVEDDRKRGVFK